MRLPAMTLLAILVIASSASGQTANDLNVVVSGGLSIPSGPTDFSKNFNSDVGIGIGLSYRLSPRIYSLNGIDINSFKFTLDVPEGVSASINGEPTFIITATSSIKYVFFGAEQGPVASYLIGGIGVFSISIPQMTTTITDGSTFVIVTTNPERETAFNASIGGGVEFPGGGLPGVFAEARYARGFTKGGATSYVPLRIGIRADF